MIIMRKRNSLFIITLFLLALLTQPLAEKHCIAKSSFSISSPLEIGWHLDQINITGAWEITNGSEDLIIAVIDSGIDFSHPELTSTSWVNVDEIADNGIDDDLNGYIDDVAGWDFTSSDNTPEPEPLDPIHWHATFISGIIAAPIDLYGIAGVAPDCRIMDIRILDEFNYAGTSYEDFGNAIRYAVDNGADVINLSLQYYANDSSYYDDIVYAISQNVPVVSVTGNTWQPTGGVEFQSFPGGYDEVIAVGATNITYAKADYSNYGVWTELVAPVGDELFITMDHLINSTLPPTYYPSTPYWGGIGTSFACPQVAGVIALMRSVNYDITVNQIRDILHDTALDLGMVGFDEYFGYGLIDATKAVNETIARYGTSPVIVEFEKSKTMIPIILTIFTVLIFPLILRRKRKVI
ncbi:MAG: S8 family serine peptidase [Candidatus Heimdallarchaeota archaeon]|nr:S8 family serine peptidase [Candidatus Heimdallarchaeota archaeon]MCK4253106.1 S8 family serine peptidase [Candidatus Heimdallarchaeota archaeon]